MNSHTKRLPVEYQPAPMPWYMLIPVAAIAVLTSPIWLVCWVFRQGRNLYRKYRSLQDI